MEIAATHSAGLTLAPSSGRLWAGRILTGVTGLFLLMDAVTHLLRVPPVVQAFARIGVPVSLAVPIGALELVCLAAYLLPRTAALGAILLTGYLGGAVAIQLRAGSPLFAEALFPVYVGVLVWGGLLLRRPGLRALLTEPPGDAGRA